MLGPLLRGECRGYAKPEKHRRTRRVGFPTEGSEAGGKSSASLSVPGDDGQLQLLVVVERVGGAGLNGRRRSVPKVRSNCVKRLDEVATPDREPDTRTSHVECLRERMELDRDILGSRYLERTRRLLAAVGELAIGEVGHEQNPVATAEGHRL